MWCVFLLVSVSHAVNDLIVQSDGQHWCCHFNLKDTPHLLLMLPN
jgi:hypothetical protein